MAGKSPTMLVLALVLELQLTRLCHSSGSETNVTNDTNFEVLLGDIELGQRPELYQVAATHNVQVNVTSDKQTIVATEGVNVRLDWSNWVSEILANASNSTGNATYTVYRTQINESGYAIGSVEEIRPSVLQERIFTLIDEETNESYVEITCVALASLNSSQVDRAIYELEICIAQNDGNVDECFNSSITLYAIADPLEIDCVRAHVGLGRQVEAKCVSTNNPIALQTCAIEYYDHMRSFPCSVEADGSVKLSVPTYPPGLYNVTFTSTDVYGQTVNKTILLFLPPPFVNGHCDREGFNIYCRVSGDEGINVLINCSYDGGAQEQCGLNITIDPAMFLPGFHTIDIVFFPENFYPTSGVSFRFTVEEFRLKCSVDNRSIPFYVVDCEGVNGDINEVSCIYDNDKALKDDAKCNLPVTLDVARFDHDPGVHNFSILANSTLGETADFGFSFNVPTIECVQLTQPGTTSLVCITRVPLIGQTTCIFHELLMNVPCVVDNNAYFSNIVISASDYPLVVRMGSSELLITGTDEMNNDIRLAIQVALRYYLPTTSAGGKQDVHCSYTPDCSANSTLMSARECCVNSEEGLSYTIPGSRGECHECVVFGWLQDTYSGVVQNGRHRVDVGYRKGSRQTDANNIIAMEVLIRPINPLQPDYDFSLKSNQLRLNQSIASRPGAVQFTFHAENGNKSLSLRLVPTPASLHALPSGEGVFFKNVLELTLLSNDTSRSLNIVLIVLCTVGIPLLIASFVAMVLSYRKYRRVSEKKKRVKLALQDLQSQMCTSYFNTRTDHAEKEDKTEISVRSSFKLDILPHLIIPSANIRLQETIGHGEFGIVYKGYVLKKDRDSFDEYLAIKTLKGFYDHSMVRGMLQECSRMSKFSHTNVLTLKGVCLDGGPAPFIIMPFMANGSLLSYLRKNRSTLTVAAGSSDVEDVEIVRKQLLDMCIQIAKGMEYLASMKVVHRDLAARNCMIDCNFVIKVADFGLSESIGTKEYFRQDQESPVKLPIKWLPPESITDCLFSEKSDVWAYGVTCWEIFSGGRVPYSDLAVRDILSELIAGYRLGKPENEACDDEMYTTMQQCWSIEPEKRPQFSELVSSLSSFLESVAGYLHIGAFGVKEDDQDQI